jgi:pantetheine-phosphate adenylyltransferase
LVQVKAVYPGSFDPPTLGHVDVIKRSLNIFRGLTVVIAESSKKTALFTALERKTLLEEILSGMNVKVEIHRGLTVDYVKKSGAKVIIRGLRAVSDFEYELQMATMNRKLEPEIETLIIMTGEEFSYISSNAVKEVALHGGDISKVVPTEVVDAVRKKLKTSTVKERLF